MGAKISGIGTSILTIEGVEKLHGARHKVIPDRIEAGSYAVAAAITGGKIELINAQTYTLKTPMQILQKILLVQSWFLLLLHTPEGLSEVLRRK